MLGKCVLKLDHFCLWVVNSVGLLNYKAFLLFIGYSTLACIETGAVMLPIAIRAIANKDNSMCACCTHLPRLYTTFCSHLQHQPPPALVVSVAPGAGLLATFHVTSFAQYTP